MNGTRLAKTFLLGHVALIVFSAVAMVTILAGSMGPWVGTEPAATVMRLSFRFAGATCIVLGTLAVLAFLATRLGLVRTLTLLLVASGISLGAELLGTYSGFPFGEYTYAGLLGHRILGLVPFSIPLSWFYMLVGALTIVARLAPAPPRPRPWLWAAMAALLMLAWDVSMDPAMVVTGHWAWGTGDGLRAAGLPEPLISFFTRDVFYGMPLSNWFGWVLTATIVARAMLALVPPREVQDKLAPSTLPMVVYLVNGFMPLAVCMRHGFWWAAAVGGLAMTVPVILALRRRSEPSTGALLTGTA